MRPLFVGFLSQYILHSALKFKYMVLKCQKA